jgi:hypothetical protein
MPLSRSLADDPPATVPAADARNLDQLKDEAKHRVTLQWQNVPGIGEKTASDVISFRFDHERLIADSSLPHDFANHLVQMRGLQGQAMIRFTPSRLDEGGFLVFEYYDFSKPQSVDIHDQVLSSPLALQVVQDTELPDSTQTVSLIQSYLPSDSDGVTMRVQSLSEIDGHIITNLVFSAPTLSTLRREHPSEVERYVRPIFASLGQDDGIFGVDEKLAWQVVSDTWQPSADLARQVNQILAGLNDDSYPNREAASKALRKMGQPAALYLMSIDRTKLTGEQSSRVDQFLHAYRPLGDDQVQVLRTDTSFLLDAMSTSDDALRAAVLQHLRKAVDRPIDFDLTLGATDRATAIAKLRQILIPPTTQRDQ